MSGFPLHLAAIDALGVVLMTAFGIATVRGVRASASARSFGGED